MKLLKIGMVALLPVLLLSCRTQNVFKHKAAQTLDSAFLYNAAYQYVIRKNDKLNISVWGQDELSVGSVYGIYNSNEAYGKWLLVDANGNIDAPRIGTLKVEGQTVTQLKDSLKLKLGQWLVNPVVDVKVLNKEVVIIGEVRNPATIMMDKDEMTLLEALGKTGGYEFYANLREVKIIRNLPQGTKTANIDLTRLRNYGEQNIQLHPGDVVVVSSKGHKEFDKRIATIIPFATAITAASILFGLFLTP